MMGKQSKCFCFPRMNNLSPAALAVWEAFNSEEPGVFVDYGDCLAAALRVAVEDNEYKPNMRDEMEVMFSEGWNSLRKELLAIAAELEGAND